MQNVRWHWCHSRPGNFLHLKQGEPWEDFPVLLSPTQMRAKFPEHREGKWRNTPRTLQAACSGWWWRSQQNFTSSRELSMELNVAGEKAARDVCDNTATLSKSLQPPDDFGRTQSQQQGVGGTAAQTSQRCCPACETDTKKAQAP